MRMLVLVAVTLLASGCATPSELRRAVPSPSMAREIGPGAMPDYAASIRHEGPRSGQAAPP